MATPKKRPSQEVGSTDIIKRLRAAQQSAVTCARGAQAARINFVTPVRRILAAENCDEFKQHVELWFSRWDAVLQEFDSIMDPDLWERLSFAARNLGPVVLHGIHFVTAFEAAHWSLQSWRNLCRTWDHEIAPNRADQCRELLEWANAISSPDVSGDIEVRIIREFSLAIADLNEGRMPNLHNEEHDPTIGDWWATTPPPEGAGWYDKPLIGAKKVLARCVGVALRHKRVDEKTLANMHGKSVWIYRVNYTSWQAYFHTDTILADANAELAKVLVEEAKAKAELAKAGQIKTQTGTQTGAKRSKREQTG